jgi:predicted nuclease of predicted toxin-antitoxin system
LFPPLLNELPRRCTAAARPLPLAGNARHRAIHVTERDGALADEAIAGWAESEVLILVSKDEDLFTIRLPDRFAFLWLRCGNATNRALMEWLEARWERVEDPSRQRRKGDQARLGAELGG